jgi:hypothetical protein
MQAEMTPTAAPSSFWQLTISRSNAFAADFRANCHACQESLDRNNAIAIRDEKDLLSFELPQTPGHLLFFSKLRRKYEASISFCWP